MEESTNLSLSTSPETYFEFKPIKKQAILILKKSFITIFFVSFILNVLFIIDGTLVPGLDISFRFGSVSLQSFYIKIFSNFASSLCMLLVSNSNSIILIMIVLLLLIIAIKLFLINPLELGARKYFIMLNRKNENKLSNLLFFFSNNYISNVKKMVRRDLMLFATALLGFFINKLLLQALYQNIFQNYWFRPISIVAVISIGLFSFLISFSLFIVAMYTYKWVPYIIAENTDITGYRAMKISENVMHGYKWKTFLFELTFLLWYILGTLAFGFGVLFVNSYMDVSKAVLYERMRGKVIKMNKAEYWELGYESNPFKN